MNKALSITDTSDTFANRRWPFGLLAFLAALVSLLTCYVTIITSMLAGSSALELNPHVQAVIMWGFGLLAVVAMGRDRARHLRNYPLAVATIGVVVMVATLYVHYDQRFEVLAFVFLFVGALLNQKAMIAALYENGQRQAVEIADLNRNLAQRVDSQDVEISRLARLKAFLPSTIAELIVQEGNEHILESHRRYIACLVCDIRGFTQFSDTAEPEETMALLRDFHKTLGEVAARHHGTIGHRAGDGVMVIFNDPMPCEEPVLDAVRLALDVRSAWSELRRPWERLGHSVGIGVGITSGYATLGLLGDEGSADYTAIGNAVNLAARLCDVAEDGQVLIDQRAYLDVETRVEAKPQGERAIKGYSQPVLSFAVESLE